MKRILVVVDDYGEHRYEITVETETVIETNSVTAFENWPIRFNKKERCLEVLVDDSFWDVYVPEECIFQVDIVFE